MPERFEGSRSRIRRWLQLEETRGQSAMDDLAAMMLHAEVIQKKKLLRRLYDDYYHLLRSRLSGGDADRQVVELGSGGGFIKAVIPQAVTSDVLALPNVDVCFSALEMPFRNASVDAFVMINVFHHIPDPRGFLREVDRTLATGGKVVMIEPANTWFARLVFQCFHHETFDPDAPWELDGERPLWDANGAIPWIVFRRDRRRFEREFPTLSIVSMSSHSPLRYLASGGFSVRQLVPGWAYGLVCGVERLLAPVNSRLGMFQTIELEKRG